MTTSTSDEPPVPQDVVVDEEARKKAEEFVEQEEGAVRRLTGKPEILVAVVAIAMSLYHLYAAYAIIPAHILRATHLGFVLFLLYLLFPAIRSQRDRSNAPVRDPDFPAVSRCDPFRIGILILI